MAEIKDITRDSFDSAVLSSEGLLLVYYHATWCKPCQEMGETLQSVADEISEKMDVVQVNTDQEEEIITQQRIRTIPTFQVFKDGKPTESIQGALSKLELLRKLSNIITQGDESEASGPNE